MVPKTKTYYLEDGTERTIRANGHGWTVQEFKDAIAGLPPMSQTALGEAIGLSQGAVSVLFKRMRQEEAQSD